MCHHSSRESLLSFGIPEITRGLRRKGCTWHKIDLLFKPDAKLNFVEIPWEWTTTSGGYLNRTEKKSSVKVYIRKDFSGLYLEIKYTLQRTLKAGEIRNEISTRYDLTKRESNLKPGTYRYYIKDPYSTLDPEGGLCTRLYFLPDIGEFVPRSILKSHGVLYSQQRKGHKERYLSPSWDAPKTKYRKSHYRGRITPFWERYEEICRELDYRWTMSAVVDGLGVGIIPPDLQGELLQEYKRITGRKTTPNPFAIYRTSRYTSRRR